MYKGELAELRRIKLDYKTCIDELQVTARDSLQKKKDYRKALKIIAESSFAEMHARAMNRSMYVFGAVIKKALNRPNPYWKKHNTRRTKWIV